MSNDSVDNTKTAQTEEPQGPKTEEPQGPKTEEPQGPKTEDGKTESAKKNEELYTPRLPKNRRRYQRISNLRRRTLFINNQYEEIPSSSRDSMSASSSNAEFKVCCSYNYLFV